MSAANNSISKSNHHHSKQTTTSGRVKQRIEQLENVTTNTNIQSTKPIPITQQQQHHQPLSLTTSSSKVPPTERRRTKSKMEIFDDVYEQLEQLDELYFENMSIDDTATTIMSSSPVIQFDNDTIINSESVPNLHIRMNSLLSRQEYESKRELICQQYYNAATESDDDFTTMGFSKDGNHNDGGSGGSGTQTSVGNQIYLDPMVNKFPYIELQNKFPQGVKQSEKEKYLTDEEFLTVFGMERSQFQSLSEYKRRRLKIHKGLF